MSHNSNNTEKGNPSVFGVTENNPHSIQG